MEEAIKVNKDYTGSHPFSMNLTQDNLPIDPVSPVENGDTIEPSRPEVKTQVTSSIQEIDNLIQKMIDSNESYPKESKLF